MDPDTEQRINALRDSLGKLNQVTNAPGAASSGGPGLAIQPPHTLIGGAENMKLLFDSVMQKTLSQAQLPNAWELLSQSLAGDIAATARRAANQALDFDYAVKMGSVLAAQAGVTEQQAQVTPIRTGAADTQVQQPAGAVYPPIRNVDQGGATATNVTQTALSAVSAQIAALQDVVSKLADALVPVIVTASGGASTPSQTQPKPAA